MFLTTTDVGAHHVANCAPPPCTLFGSTCDLSVFNMSLRGRTVRNVVELPDPEAPDATAPLNTEESEIQELTNEPEEPEGDEEEEEEQTDPEGASPEKPTASPAEVPSETPATNKPNTKKETTSVVCDTALLVPRLPSDFLEPGDVRVNDEDLRRTRRLQRSLRRKPKSDNIRFWRPLHKVT